MGIEGCW